MSQRNRFVLRKWINLLLLLPCLAALWVPMYNHDRPRLFGIPYFYLWQLAWIWLGAGLTGIVYLVAWKGRDQ